MPKSEDASAVPGYDGRPGDWIVLSQAARILGMSRQNVALMAHRGKFQSLHTIAQGTMYVVSEAEVLGMVALKNRAGEQQDSLPV